MESPDIRKNIAANYLGKLFAGIVTLAFIPLYLRFLGIEAYGLIGIYVSIMALLAALDLGLGATLNRELARLSVAPDSRGESRDLLRTLETVYWGMGALTGLIIVACAPLLVDRWLTLHTLPRETVLVAVMLMGLGVSLEWPTALYSGGLLGLQQQVRVNLISSVTIAIRAGGAVLILWLISPTIFAYFAWHAAVSLAQSLYLARCVWSSLPAPPEAPSFRFELLKKNCYFAAGLTGISILVTLLTQTDKVILSKVLSLEQFGYYILAFNIAGVLTQMGHPFFVAFFPKFSRLFAENLPGELSRTYHRGSQAYSFLLFPPAMTLAFFSKEILSLWIGLPRTGEDTHLLLSVLVVGTCLNALMVIPYALQLAYGWTKLSFFVNLGMAVVMVPSLIWASLRFGSLGAATIWGLINLGYIFTAIPLMHRRLLRGEMWRWYVIDVGAPLMGALTICVLSRLSMPAGASAPVQVLWIAGTGLFSLIAAAWTTPVAREWISKREGMTATCPNCAAESRLFLRTRDFNRRITRETFHYYKCSPCGLLFLHPVPGNLGTYYPTDYHSVPSGRSEMALQAEHERYKLDLVREYKENGRLLEIGPSWGGFCLQAKAAGYDVEAFEMDPGCCRFLNDVIGITAFQGNDIVGLLKSRPAYDVVALWHVMEHLANPWNVLAAISGKLAPGGVLVVATPNPAAWQFGIQGKFWPHVDAPRHLFLIPDGLLSRKARDAGLETVFCTTRDEGSLGWNTFGWQFFLGNFFSNRFLKAGMHLSGRAIGKILSPLENREGKGCAYTIVLKKTGQE